jgi:hypothetical protein
VVVPFGVGEKLADTIIAQSGTKTEGPSFGAVRLGCRRRENLLEANPESGVNHLFERFPKPGGALSSMGGHIRIERQSGSHSSIMMPIW